MGTFRIEVQAVGGHGCQREVKDGEVVQGCGHERCPDCIARKFVNELKAAGVYFGVSTSADRAPTEYAKLTHWPGQSGEVRDDLLTGVRSGSF